LELWNYFILQEYQFYYEVLNFFHPEFSFLNILYLFPTHSMVITLCYDAVSRNVEGMGISPFIMFSLSALAVLPSSILLVLLQDRIGRKGMASGSLLVGGLFSLLAPWWALSSTACCPIRLAEFPP